MESTAGDHGDHGENHLAAIILVVNGDCGQRIVFCVEAAKWVLPQPPAAPIFPLSSSSLSQSSAHACSDLAAWDRGF